MAVDVDLSVALDLTAGSVPISLRARIDTGSRGTDLVFDGSVSGIALPLSDFLRAITEEFGIGEPLPVELQLTAVLDYVVA